AVAQLRGALGQVVVVELRDVVLIHRHLISRRLRDRHRHVVEGGQPVTTLVVGAHHLAAVGDHDAGQTVLVAVPGAVLVRVDEHLAGQHRIVGGTGRGAYDFDLAAG